MLNSQRRTSCFPANEEEKRWHRMQMQRNVTQRGGMNRRRLEQTVLEYET